MMRSRMMRRAVLVLVAAAVLVLLFGRAPGAGAMQTSAGESGGTSAPYVVRRGRDSREAAALLAELARRLRVVAEADGSDERLARLRQRWDGSLGETQPGDSDIAYTSNKKSIRICLRKPDGSLEGLSQLTFVLLHEAGHVVTPPPPGHSKAFWRNFKYLLEVAAQQGVYEYTDTSEESLCGTRLGTNPLQCVIEGSCRSSLPTPSSPAPR